VVELLISLPSLISLAFERLDRVFRSEALFETDQIFKVQNFEHHHSHLALEPGESPPTLAAEEGFFKQLAAAFPHLRTVKLSLTSESDNYMERLTTLTHLQEVIIDFPGHLGSGFHKFFQKCGQNLNQLGLTLTQVSANDIEKVSRHCPALKVLHLFFVTLQVDDASERAREKLFPNLEGLYLGLGRTSSPNLTHTLLTDRFISCCSKLRTLYLSGVSGRLDDNYLVHKLEQGCLANLENCHIKEEGRLSKKAYLGLMKHCPLLHRINLSSWNVPRGEFLQLEQEVREQNLDLVLTGGKA